MAADLETVRRLGVIGGSFDPIHLAHLITAETVHEALHLDLVLFVPVGQQPLKQGRPIAPAEHRAAMVELAIAGNPTFALSRVDIDRPGPSYTADTLEQLRREWTSPAGEAPDMWFIVGGDSLLSFPRWRDPDRILACARLAAVRRPGAEVDARSLPPALTQYVDFVDAPLMDISSTDIRRRLAEGASVRYRVPGPVLTYIESNGLYALAGGT